MKADKRKTAIFIVITNALPQNAKKVVIKSLSVKNGLRIWIEDKVIEGLTIILNDDATLSAMADKLLELFEEDNVVVPALEAQLKEVQKSIANLIKAVEQGLVTRSTKSRLEELEAEEETLKESIFIEQNKVPRLSKEQILCVLERFRSLDLSIERNRERLVDALVKCIVLYDDKFIITVTFRDEPIVVMTSEEAADVARLGSDINSLAQPRKHRIVSVLFSLISVAKCAETNQIYAAQAHSVAMYCVLSKEKALNFSHFLHF